MIGGWLKSKIRGRYEWGVINGTLARRRRGRVEFMLWPPGHEYGGKKGYWHEFGIGWEEKFTPLSDFLEKEGNVIKIEENGK